MCLGLCGTSTTFNGGCVSETVLSRTRRVGHAGRKGKDAGGRTGVKEANGKKSEECRR